MEESGTTREFVDNQAESLAKYHLVIFQQNPRDSINRTLVYNIQNLLDEKITTSPESTEIDVWLESPGGDIHSAYKLILDLRSRCNRLYAVVPDYAKSAATLMALGMDCIFMSAAAELGPLDVQLEHPDRENVTISGLDMTNSLAYLTKTALDLTIAGGVDVLRYTQLSRIEILHELLQFMAQFLKPTVSRLDPHIIHKATNELKIAEQYALRMLEMRNLPDEKRMTTESAKELLTNLIKNYPTHGFVISRDEAQQLGLPIGCAEESYPRWQSVKRIYNFSCQTQNTFVDLLVDSELDKPTEPTEESKVVGEAVEPVIIAEPGGMEDSHEAHKRSKIKKASKK